MRKQNWSSLIRFLSSCAFERCLPIAEYLCSAMCGNASVKMSGCITTFVEELSWYVSLMARMTKTGRIYERGRALNNEDGESYERGRALNNEDGESLRARKSLK